MLFAESTGKCCISNTTQVLKCRIKTAHLSAAGSKLLLVPKLIADVAARKCHQWLEEIKIILTHTSSRKSDKLFSKRVLSRNICPRHLTQYRSHSILLRTCFKRARFKQHKLVINACIIDRKH